MSNVGDGIHAVEVRGVRVVEQVLVTRADDLQGVPVALELTGLAPAGRPLEPLGFTHLHNVGRKNAHGLCHYHDSTGESRAFDRPLFLLSQGGRGASDHARVILVSTGAALSTVRGRPRLACRRRGGGRDAQRL